MFSLKRAVNSFDACHPYFLIPTQSLTIPVAQKDSFAARHECVGVRDVRGECPSSYFR
jgi:hypothetical protein